MGPISNTRLARLARAASEGGSGGGSGPAGPPGTAATITVGTVTTGAPGSSVTITNAGTTSAAVFNFTIPQGATGATGSPGTNGTNGSDANVTNANVNTAITANPSASRTALGLGSAALSATGDFATAGHTHADVTAGGASGFMSGTDKAKLNAITGTNTGDETSGTILTKLSGASGGGTTNFLRADGTWAAPAGGGSSTAGLHGTILTASGTYQSNLLNGTTLTAVVGAANRLECSPYIPSKTITVNELAIEVTTLVAASSIHVGIYAANSNGTPGALIVGTTTAFSGATTGVKNVAISNTTLTAGTLYWLMVFHSSTAAIRAIPLASAAPVASPTSGTGVPTIMRATATFGALPSTAPAMTATSAVAPPWVRLKLA